MIHRILGKTGVEVRARQVLLAVLATACAATTSSSLAPASLEVGDVVRKTREQYAQVQDGYGKVLMQQEIEFAPDFAVNTGADPYFSDVASMFPDDNVWEKQALNAVSNHLQSSKDSGRK
jgi:hypothetical protein